MALTTFGELTCPIIGAPMAGGASTPALAEAVCAAGGMGFLAAGYLTAAGLDTQIAELEKLTTRAFGVNLFVPSQEPADAEAVAEYRSRLEPYARERGVTLTDPPIADDDAWEDKLDVVISRRVPVVSFTFGCPPPDMVGRLHAADVYVVATVTSAQEALAAHESGVDALCVQGPEAGAHRGTFTPRPADPDEPGLLALLAEVTDAVALPAIAAGGLATGADIAAVLDAGAVAAQLGTALLRTPESGAHAVHKAALVDPRYTQTVVTRAFSGREARGLRNGFIDAFDAVAPRGYPQIHHLTKPLRAASAARGDSSDMSLWAGLGHALSRSDPAGRVVAELAAEAGRLRRG